MNAARMLKLMEDLRSELAGALSEERDEFALFFFQCRRELTQAALHDGKHARRQRGHILQSWKEAKDRFGLPLSLQQWERLLDCGKRPPKPE